MASRNNPIDFVEVSSGTADVDAKTTPTTLYGYSFRESAATAAAGTIIIRHGTGDNTGAIVAVIEFAADASETNFFSSPIKMPDGVRIHRELGETEGAIYVERSNR